jgi:hypothetical protein
MNPNNFNIIDKHSHQAMNNIKMRVKKNLIIMTL